MIEVTPLGDSALIVRLPVSSADLDETLDAVLNAEALLQAANLAGVIEIAPAPATLAVFFDAVAVATEYDEQPVFEALRAAIRRVLSGPALATARSRGRTHEIPVCYEAEFAPDLAEMARHAGISMAEVVGQHAAVRYRVSCLGFAPGFPYLNGLPSALAMPRRASPRTEVAAGSVAIGGAHTGIYPQVSPGGWNLIGRTPLRLFDPSLPQPALLAAGDHVRFRAIARVEFEEQAVAAAVSDRRERARAFHADSRERQPLQK